MYSVANKRGPVQGMAPRRKTEEVMIMARFPRAKRWLSCMLSLALCFGTFAPATAGTLTAGKYFNDYASL